MKQPFGYLNYLNPDIFHSNLYQVAAAATLFSGFTLALLLAFAKREGQAANLFLSVALTVIVLKTGGLSPVFLPALGPLLYFYVRRLTSPNVQFGRKDALHFCPLLIANWIPVWLMLISIVIYIYLSHRLIQQFYNLLQPALMDKPRVAFRRLEKALHLLGFLCVLWLFNDALSFAVAFLLIGIAAEVTLKSDSSVQLAAPVTDRYDIKEKSRRLKEAVAVNRIYEDAELTLTTLAVKLNIRPHELSRIINVGMEKNFSDFINELRVRETVRKMQNPAYERLTLLGIAYESGFNSQRTFNRVFKEITGKTPVEYKNALKKELPNDKLAIPSQLLSVVLRSESPPGWAPVKLNRNYMFRNYLKIATRNLIKNKLYSVVNIAGLAVGLASAILILLWVQDELGHDRFFSKIDRIYLMNGRAKLNNGDIGVGVYTPKPMALALKAEYPDVEEAVRVRNAHFLVSNGDKHFGALGHLVDSKFLTVFDFPMLEGNPKMALDSVNNIVLTEHLAKKLFGGIDVLGKIVKLDSVNYATVTGVLKDLPGNTTFDFEYLVSWAYANKLGWNDNDWNNNSVYTYVLLKQGASTAAFDQKVDNILIKHTKPDNIMHVFSQPYKNAWLYSSVENGNYVGGKIKQVRLFIIIAVFILLIACINFTNLSTARSEKRAKEVGIRKVAGAPKYSLIIQFISESVLLALAAGIIAVVIVLVALPSFNLAIGETLTINYANPWYYLYTLGFILFTGITAGLYPAFFLSSFQPIKVLKGTFQPVKALVTPRKLLVILQFTCAIVFIICTIIVQGQIKYAQGRDAGYSRNNLIFVRMTGNAAKNYRLIKHDLLTSGAVTNLTATSGPMTELWSNNSGYSWPGSEANDQKTIFNTYSADDDFSKTMHLSVLHGRDIDLKDYPTDSTGVLLNQTAVKVMRLKNPVGAIIKGNGKSLHVVGIVKDFILESPYAPVHPMLIMGPVFPFYIINFRLNPEHGIAESLAKSENIFKQYNPNYPFEPHFYDQEYALKFADEEREGTLAGLFAGLAVFISCLGLFGLVTYMAESRVKEIGIRKVLGASAAGIVGLISKDFLKLIGFSFVIAAPIAWFFMNKWLMGYEYRIKISWWVFAGTGLLSILIALLTISFQAIKAAMANPVKSLRAD